MAASRWAQPCHQPTLKIESKLLGLGKKKKRVEGPVEKAKWGEAGSDEQHKRKSKRMSRPDRDGKSGSHRRAGEAKNADIYSRKGFLQRGGGEIKESVIAADGVGFRRISNINPRKGEFRGEVSRLAWEGVAARFFKPREIAKAVSLTTGEKKGGE